MRLSARIPALLVLLGCAGCAHHPLSASDLDRVAHPAFISRIEEAGGPRSSVFRDDGSWAPKLKKLDPKEADRRLAARMQEAMTRFEIAERLRATTFSQLPHERPWTETINPARVANVLQSFLVQEVPANAPDYQLVKDVGADCVVEFVIEEYGMRSEGGKAGAYLLGYGRMFTLDGSQLWRRNFEVDQLKSNMGGINPFAIKDDKQLWRDAMDSMLDAVAIQFAKDLTPADRHGAAQPGTEENKPGGDTETPKKNEQPEQQTPPPEESPI